MAPAPRLGIVAPHAVHYQIPLYRELHARQRLKPILFMCSDLGARRLDPDLGAEVDWGDLLANDLPTTWFKGSNFVDVVIPNRIARNLVGRIGDGRGVRLPVPSAGLVHALWQWLRRERPDVVLITGHGDPRMVLAATLCRLARVPYVVRGTGLPSIRTGRGRIQRLLARYVVSGAAAGLAIGEWNREFLEEMGARSVFRSPYSVDAAYYRGSPARGAAHLGDLRRDGTPLVAFVGKMQPWKRPGDLIDAVGHLSRPVDVVFVGGGPQRQGLCREKVGLALVSEVGVLDPSELRHVLAASDVLVLPSVQETWGVVVNEAMANGVVPIVSDGVACGPDLVAGVGEVFPTRDVHQLARSIEEVLSTLAERRELALQRIAKYSLEWSAEGIERAVAAAVG